MHIKLYGIPKSLDSTHIQAFVERVLQPVVKESGRINDSRTILVSLPYDRLGDSSPGRHAIVAEISGITTQVVPYCNPIMQAVLSSLRGFATTNCPNCVSIEVHASLSTEKIVSHQINRGIDPAMLGKQA